MIQLKALALHQGSRKPNGTGRQLNYQPLPVRLYLYAAKYACTALNPAFAKKARVKQLQYI